uniref:Basonuclin zinc finger protein 1 n=1 Tax=Paramormyrops kingsleyae TaxID=1676925 RepID=A0A3B3Q8C2_9TELE
RTNRCHYPEACHPVSLSRGALSCVTFPRFPIWCHFPEARHPVSLSQGSQSGAICCTLVDCGCKSFKPGRLRTRQCDLCRHGWVAHALSRLTAEQQVGPVEAVRSGTAFDVCSLMLFGTQAVPVRLKILLDRLLSVLRRDEVGRMLATLGWTLQDYMRGYILQDVTGKILDRWAMMTFEEEVATLQQFLRFGETRSIAELMAAQGGLAGPLSDHSSELYMGATPENSDPCWPGHPAAARKEPAGERHPFNMTLLTNMTFMFPLHYLSSTPTPLPCSSPTARLFQPGPGPKEEDPDTKSNFVLFTPEEERNRQPAPAKLAVTAASETPLTFDPMHIFPKKKTRATENSSNSGSGFKKGRVFCSTCKKTFYDKGTLKIHYNAVHLKVKHCCTVQGCNMVFSSLRSRNRHSANPNPRLHTPLNPNTRMGTLRDGSHTSAPLGGEKRSNMNKRLNMAPICPPKQATPTEYTPHVSVPKPQGQSETLSTNLRTKQPTVRLHCSDLGLPVEGAITLGVHPSQPSVISSGPADQQRALGPVTKKKPRKSSMPIKIKREIVERCSDNKVATVRENLDLRLSTELSISMDTASSDPTRNDRLSKLPQIHGHKCSACEQLENQAHAEDKCQTTSEGLFRILTNHMQGSEAYTKDSIGDLPHLVCLCQGNAPNHCIKSSESSYTIRTHYCSACVEQMHLCAMHCCTAVDPTWGGMRR